LEHLLLTQTVTTEEFQLQTLCNINNLSSRWIRDPKGSLFLCLNTCMNDKQAAKLIIKRAKKHPKLYTSEEVRYAKEVKKLEKKKKVDD